MKAVGSACAVVGDYKGRVHDCQPGSMCLAQSDGNGRCVKLAKLGEPCTLDRSEAICFESRLADKDNEFASSFNRLECVPNTAGSNLGSCKRDLADGQPCHSREVCASGRCAPIGTEGANTCLAKAADGRACMVAADCASGACNLSVDTGICSAPLADGISCGYDDASCASGKCYTPDNQTSGSHAGACGPKLERAVGATCAQGYECVTDTCRNDHCIESICRRYL